MSVTTKPMTLEEYFNYDDGTDTRYEKRTEYAGRHIPEYWIVDPIAQKVTILEWVDDLYKEQVYQGGRRDRLAALTSVEVDSSNRSECWMLTGLREGPSGFYYS